MTSLWYDIFSLLVFVGLIALAVAGIVASRREQGQHNRSSAALWDDLRRAHGLSRRQARLLRKAAEAASLDPRSLIFVEPHVLLRLVDQSPAERAEIQQLMSRLYS